MRHVVMLLLALALGACGSPPRPFEHDPSETPLYQPKQDAADVTIETPANMPQPMAERLAAALAIELQSYGIVAVLSPARAPLRITGAMTTRDAPAGNGIEVEVEWYLLSGGKVEGPAVSKTSTQSNDYAEASDSLVSRMAQQAAPRVASLMGHTPDAASRSVGAVVAGVTMPDPTVAADPAAQTAAAMPGVPAKPSVPAPPAEPQVKVMVGAITGAPSDGNQQLFSGMRRALGSNKIVVIDKAGNDAFVVSAVVSTAPVDDHTVQLTLKWTVKDPSGKELGNVEQSNPVAAAAARGSWAGFGDIVASAAVDGVLELLEKALNRPH